MKSFVSYLLVFLLTFSTLAENLRLTLSRRINFRQNQEGILQKRATLPAGTVVEIPEEFVPSHLQGEERNERALMAWLKKESGKLQRFQGKNRVQRDFFANIKIVSIPQKNLKWLEGQKGQLAIRYLARKSGIKLVTTQPTDLVQPAPPQPPNPPTSTSISNPGKECKEPIPSSPLDKFKNDLDNILKIVARDRISRLPSVSDGPWSVLKRIEETCRPKIKAQEFLKTLVVESRKANLPPEIMLASLHTESNGRCHAVNPESDRSASVGLFQINVNSARKRYKVCGHSRRSAVSVSQNCLEHPLTNLREAIRIMSNKYRRVNDGPPPRPMKSWKKMNDRERDYWRKAVAAYNGGEGYIYQAYNDIQSFNRKFNTKYDPNDWRVRRLFFFRNTLEENGKKYFSNNYKYKRSKENAILNVVHTETILGAGPGSNEGDLINRWAKFLGPY